MMTGKAELRDGVMVTFNKISKNKMGANPSLNSRLFQCIENNRQQTTTWFLMVDFCEMLSPQLDRCLSVCSYVYH